MSFLAIPELKTGATIEIITLITNSDDSIVVEIIEESIEVIKGYLYQYYDTDLIFNAVGDERKKLVLKHLKNIVIYEVYTRRSKTMNEVAAKKYDDTILFLEQVAIGKVKPDLPPRTVDTDGDGLPDGEVPFMKLGGKKTYKNHW